MTLIFLASLNAGEARCQSLLSDIANSPASALPLAYTNDDASRSGTTGEDQVSGESNDEPSSIYSPKGENSPNLVQQTTFPNGDPIPNPPSESAALIAKSRARMARANFDKGMQYRQSGDSSRALIEFLKATREDPKLIDAYYEQALIFREKGFHKLAVSRLEQALAIRPKYSRARLLLATLKLEQGKVSDAVEQLGESLNLQKSQTAIKPDEETNGINLMDGVPPMILQSLHAALPLPAVPEAAKTIELAEASDEEPAETREPKSKETAKTAASKRKRRPANRRKIRELIARKYKTKNKNSEQRQNWIAKLFSWPDTFKADATEDNRVAYADDEDTDDLEPKPASNLKKEFRAQTDEETVDENALPRSKGTLLAYNGNPADTLDVLNSKNERKRVIDDSDTVDRPFGWGVDSPSSPASTRPQRSSSSREDRSTAVAHAHSVQSNQSPPSSRGAHSLIESPAVIEPEQSQTKRSKAERVAGIDRANLNTNAGNSPATSSSGRATLVHTNDDDGTPFYLNAHKADSRLIASRPTSPQQLQQQPVKLPPLTRRNPAMVEDEWTKRLRYLAENGTSSLKHGEAFMFSEDTGEAVLFLASGQRIRRMITAPVDSQEVIKMRRPDVLIPKELFFNTSLLGKVVKDQPAPPPVSPNPIPPPRGMNAEMDDEMEQLLKSRPSSASPTTTPPPNFKIEQIMDNPTGFWNWSKRLLNL